MGCFDGYPPNSSWTPVIPKAPPCAGPRVLHDDIGLGGQLEHELPGLRPVEVETDEVLVEVGPEEPQARPPLRQPPGQGIQGGLVPRGGVPHGLTRPGLLDLDDLGAELAEIARAARPENVLRAGQD